MGPYWWPIFSDLKKLEEKNVKVIITSRVGAEAVQYFLSHLKNWFIDALGVIKNLSSTFRLLYFNQ